jgi:uncharacterized protein DUF2795
MWAVLQDVRYPAVKQDLIDKAAAAGAREDLMSRLGLLPDTPFEDDAQLGRALARTRAASNPALVAITAEPCEHCGFPVVPGRAHSCIEEKALFAESANDVTDEFETLDERREP